MSSPAPGTRVSCGNPATEVDHIEPVADGVDALGGSFLPVVTALIVSSTAAIIFILILVAVPILYWILLALGRLGRGR